MRIFSVNMLIYRFMATFAFTGYLPKMPGTWGSLAALLVWWFVPSKNLLLQLFLIFSTIFIGVFVAQKISNEDEKHDPGYIVIDEVAGMWIALFLIPHSIPLFFIGFVLFRIFDIFKFSIIDKSQNLKGGWGIMMDDILAGIFSRIILIGVVLIL